MEKNLAYIHSKGNDVWVDTFSKVFNYEFLRSQTSIETKAIDLNSVDFVLHSNDTKEKLLIPLTVMIKEQDGQGAVSAQALDGHALKAWSCASDKWCVDVGAYDQQVHVSWSNKSH